MGTTKKGQAGNGYGPRNNTREDNTTPAKYGAVVKLQWLRATASRPDIPRATLAACIILADHADATTGICWPSFATIAKATGTTTRGTKYAITKAVKAGLISITEHGNRVRSNRYRLNLEAIGSEAEFTTSGSEAQFTGVVNASAIGSEARLPDVVKPSSPESIHLSEHQARDRWEISGNPDGDALAPRPGGAQLARQPDRYPEFWEAVGKRATVAESEQLIAEYLAEGVEYADIIAGADRWKHYNAITGGRKATSPAKWLERQKWRDDWTPPQHREATKPATSKAGNGTTSNAKMPEREMNPEYVEWKQKHDEKYAEFEKRAKEYKKAWDANPRDNFTDEEWETLYFHSEAYVLDMFAKKRKTLEDMYAKLDELKAELEELRNQQPAQWLEHGKPVKPSSRKPQYTGNAYAALRPEKGIEDDEVDEPI